MDMKEPRVPPMTLCGRRSGGFLKEPVYWCKKECMLWEVGGRPFLMKGSERQRGRFCFKCCVTLAEFIRKRAAGITEWT